MTDAEKLVEWLGRGGDHLPLCDHFRLGVHCNCGLHEARELAGRVAEELAELNKQVLRDQGRLNSILGKNQVIIATLREEVARLHRDQEDSDKYANTLRNRISDYQDTCRQRDEIIASHDVVVEALRERVENLIPCCDLLECPKHGSRAGRSR